MMKMHVMLMLMLWNVNACLTLRDVTKREPIPGLREKK
jgi:hypothetical protein